MAKYFASWQDERDFYAELACWDNDGGDGGEGGDGDGGDGGDGGSGSGSGSGRGNEGGSQRGGGRTFTQEEVNEFVQKRNKNLRSQYENLEKQYESLLENSQMSQEQREKLEGDLENVRAQLRTREQQLQYEKKQEISKFQKELEAAQKQGTYYKSLYENSTIERAIVDAAASNEGYDGNQFVALLRDRAKVVEELDNDGQKTGRLVPVIEWDVTDPETKKTERVVKRPDEVVQLMKEDVQRYGNLFKSNVARGLGQGQANLPGARGKINVKNLTQAEYRELRKTAEGRRALGLE